MSKTKEKSAMYSLLIQANDCLLPEDTCLTSTVHVSIYVKDINDNSPLFISDNTVSCSIADSGANGDVLYSLDNLGRGSFNISRTTGVTYLQKPLDRDLEELLMLMVTAKDKGFSELSSSINLTVLVEDINDHNPVFSQASYSVLVYEDTPQETRLVTIQANGNDTGHNREVQYEITESGFVVDSVLGFISIIYHLDRERNYLYSFMVTVVYKGDIQRSSTATINITVLDVNVCIPVLFRKIIHITSIWNILNITKS